MPLEQSHPGKRRDVVEVMEEFVDGTAEPPAKKRRIFLQTMGQQLREVGVGSGDATSPFAQSLGRGGSVTSSVNDCPTDRSQGRQVQIQTPESDAVPGEDDQLLTGATMSASRALWQQDEILENPVSDGSDAFKFDDLITWTRSYFDHWHPAYPFLHAPTVLEYFDLVVQHGIQEVAESSPHKLTIIRSIISISLADRRQTKVVARPVPLQLVFPTVNAAVQSIQSLLTDETSILSLQAVVSVQLLLISMLRYNAASRLEGLAVRMAFHLGLHRCPKQFTAIPKKDAELRQRLFCSMYCIDRYICIRLGVPLAIRDSEIDACFLTSERHGDASHEPSDKDNRLDLLEFLAKHAKIRGSISELRNKSLSERHPEVDEAVIIGAELTKWWNEVEEYLETRSAGSSQISRYHQVTLVVLRHESVIALYKHTLATSKLNSAYDAALQNCVSASRSIVTTLHGALGMKGDLPVSEAPGDSDHCGLLWPSFTWAVWMSVFLVMHAANEYQVPQAAAIRLSDRALEVLKHLTLRGSNWPNACAAAIRDLRTKLITRKSRSNPGIRYGHSTTNGGEQSQSMLHASSGLTSQQSGHNSGSRTPCNTIPQREQQQYPNIDRSVSASKQAIFRSHQDSGTAQALVDLQQANKDSSLQHQQQLANLSSITQSQFARPSWTFNEPMPSFNVDGAGYSYRFGPQNQIVPDLQMQSWENSELLHEMDTPFWISNDQWLGIGGSGNRYS